MAGRCFIIMPFRKELHYFYLYLKDYLNKTYGLTCQRADDAVSFGSFSDKIKRLIKDADIIIAECTGGNPNVFYEVGIAHSLEKYVILMMQVGKDFTPQEIPSDVRHYDFLLYELDNHTEFLNKLDERLNNYYFERYKSLYKRAEKLIADFSLATKLSISIVSENVFVASLKEAERDGPLLSPYSPDGELAFSLLTLAIVDGDKPTITGRLADWIRSWSPKP